MSIASQAEFQAEVVKLMEGLSGEWEYSGPVSAETRFFADMELRSLDFAVLAGEVVRKYGRIPFDVFYNELTTLAPEDREVTVGQFVDFVWRNLPQNVAST